MTTNVYSVSPSEKIIVLFFTLLLMGIISLGIRAESLIVFLLLPFIFDSGHFSLSIFYQLKSKQFNLFYILKIIASFIFCGVLIKWGNPTFNRWIVYAFGSWHILHGEKYILRSSINFKEWEVLLPAAMYSYLTYLKYFNVEIHKTALYIFAALTLSYIFWLFKNKRMTKMGGFFLYFTLLNLFALLFYEEIPLLFIVVFYIYFHYISWYIYGAKKSLDLKKFTLVSLAVNLFFFMCVLVLIFLPFGEKVAKYLHESFFVTGWLLFHLVLTIRPFGQFLKN